MSFDNIFLLGDNESLVSFDSPDALQAFLSMKDALKEFFSNVAFWDNNLLASHRLVCFNVLGIPFKLWNLDFMKVIG